MSPLQLAKTRGRERLRAAGRRGQAEGEGIGRGRTGAKEGLISPDRTF